MPMHVHMVRAKRLVAKLARSDARLIELTAPAGFGKSTLARAIGEAAGAYEVVPPSGEHLIRSLEAHYGQPFVAIVDQGEGIPKEQIASIASAIEWAPPSAHIILCSRRRTELHTNIVLAPNERLTLTADDLAFRPYEAHSVFDGLHLDDERLARLDALCEGWPVAVLSFKRALEDGGAEFDGSLNSRFLAPLVSYLSDNVIETLNDREWKALLLCCGMPGLQRRQLTALEAPAAAFRLAEMGLASFDNERGLRPRMLLRQLVDDFFSEEREGVLLDTAVSFVKADLPAHAAVAFMNAGNFPAAEQALHAYSDDPKRLTTLPYQALSAAARRRVHNGAASGLPHIWVAMFPERRYEEPARVLYREAVNLGSAVAPATPMNTMFRVLSSIVATELGMLDEAEERLNASATDENSRALVACARAMLDAYHGDMSATARWTAVRAQFWGCYAWLTLMMRLDLKAAVAGGEHPGGLSVIERILAAAEKSGSTLLVAHVLAAAVVTAWIFGDDAVMNESLNRLKTVLLLAPSRPLPALFRALCGEYDAVFDHYPVYSGYARLLAAGSNAQQAVALATAAMEEGDRIGDLGLRVLSRAALSALQPESAKTLLAECRKIHDRDAAGCETRERTSAKAFAGMDAFFARFAPLAPSKTDNKPNIRIEIANGHVYRDDAEISLSRKNLELCMLLAVEGKPLSRDAIFARLWPDQAPDATYSTLKMCVHRTRQQLGAQDAILAQRGCYTFNPDVSTDARMLLDSMAKAEPAAVFEMLRRGRPSEFAAWDWFIPVEERLIATTIDLGLELASRALNEGAVEKALEYAALLTNIDPTSEEATEVLIRAHLERGERSLAISRYQRLLRSLKGEMQAEPSLHIQRLMQ